jgi:hypothetical protein
LIAEDLSAQNSESEETGGAESTSGSNLLLERFGLAPAAMSDKNRAFGGIVDLK